MANKGTGMFSNPLGGPGYNRKGQSPQTPLPNGGIIKAPSGNGMIKAPQPSLTKAPAPSTTGFTPGQYIGQPPKSYPMSSRPTVVPSQTPSKTSQGPKMSPTQKKIGVGTKTVTDLGAPAKSKSVPQRKGK